MVFYIKHCPLTCGSRRSPLEKHLSTRNVKDPVWITDYPKNDPYVIWMHNRLGITMNLGFTSGLVKTLETLRMFVLSNEKSAFFADDDVVLVKNWDSFPIPDRPYVNMSVGVNFSILPDGKQRIIGNNGGCELMYMTKEFAQYMLDNVDARQPIDVVIHGLMKHAKTQLVCVPVAQQTSILELESSSLGDSGTPSWIEFVRNFKPTGIRYEELRHESGFFDGNDASIPRRAI